MRGLKPKESFVGNGIKNKKHPRNWKVLVSAVILLLIASSAMVGVFASSSAISENKVPSLGDRAVQQDFGPGYKNPQVVSTGSFFIAATVTYGKLNVTYINPVTGDIYGSYRVAEDVYKWYFRIDWDGSHNVLLVTWLNGSAYINGTFVSYNGTSFSKTDNFTITSDAGTTAFGLAYDSVDSEFLLVWSDTNFKNNGKIITYDPSNPNSPIIGNQFYISSDTHSHADNFVAYESNTNHFLVLWRNYSGSSGLYNITGKLLDKDGNAITGDITVGDGFSAGTKYDYPSAEGGQGEFFVAYVNYNSPYDIHGVIMNATDGSLGTTFQIGNSAGSSTSYYGGFVGIAFTGSGFITVWTTEKYDIVSMLYDLNGNATLSQPLVISATSDTEEWQDVAYDAKPDTYYFVWQDWTNHHNYGSLWTSSEIPEFSAFLPILIVAVVAFIAIKRRH